MKTDYLIFFGNQIITKSRRGFRDLLRSLRSNGILQKLELLSASQGCQYNQTPPSFFTVQGTATASTK